MEKNKNFGKEFFLKLKEKISKEGNKLDHDELYTIYVSVGGSKISSEKNIQTRILKNYFYYHKIQVKKQNNSWIFNENVEEMIEQKINSFCKRTISTKTKKKNTAETKSTQKEVFEVIVSCSSSDGATLSALAGGKIIQNKDDKLFKIEVPVENKRKLFGFWVNSEVNGFGTIMVDVNLEKEFTEAIKNF